VKGEDTVCITMTVTEAKGFYEWLAASAGALRAKVELEGLRFSDISNALSAIDDLQKRVAGAIAKLRSGASGNGEPA
jgi:hypothetical protein